MITQYYRSGEHNARNIYRAGADRDTDEHIGLMLTPEMARLTVLALNAYPPGATQEDSDQESVGYQAEPDMSLGAALRMLADAVERIEAYAR